MKFTKFYIFLFLSLIINYNLIAQGVLEKTLVKTIDPKGQTVVSLDFSNPIEIRQSNSSFIRVDIEIAASNINENTLKSLITAGRYNIDVQVVGSELVMKPSKLNKPIVINSQEWKEDKVSFIIYVPSTVKVNTSKSSL